MLRPTLLALAFSCAIACTSYGQQPNTQPQSATPSPTAKPSSPEAAKSAETKPATPATNVPMSEPVITLKGACPAKNGTTPSGCVTTLTREQFEKLTNALQPPDRGPVPPEVRRRFATQYAKLLVLADAARELGLENDPRTKQIFDFARTQILAEALNQHYTEEFSHPSEQQVQDYYNKNEDKYHEVTLQRIIIPMQQTNDGKPKPTEAEAKAYADSIRDQWAKGGDPTKLEKDAMEHAGMTTSSPDVNVGARRPGSLPEAHEAVFKMKAGEVSPVYSDPAAFYIYKVVSERQVPLSEVQTQISQTLQREEHTAKMQELETSVTPVLNDAYFGPETAASEPPMRPGMPGMPPHGPHGGPPMPPPGAPAAPPAAPAQNPGTASK